MDSNNFSSNILAEAVKQFSKLPGVGKKTALRLVMHLLKQDTVAIDSFTTAIQKLHTDIQHCRICHNISDEELCGICSNKSRNHNVICVVENIKDVISIENTGQFNGVYHILGGLIAPLDGIGPDQLNIMTLMNRVQDVNNPIEIIMALSSTLEGDTTVYYISKQLQSMQHITISTIARGIAFGGELEYTDDYTLGKAIVKRLPIDILK